MDLVRFEKSDKGSSLFHKPLQIKEILIGCHLCKAMPNQINSEFFNKKSFLQRTPTQNLYISIKTIENQNVAYG